MRVFVTDGDNRAALAITRSLGRAGHEVIVGEKQLPAFAQTSKYCAAGVVYPDPITASDDFIRHLAAVVRERRVDVLLPVSDITTLLVTEHRAAFGDCAIPFAPAAVVSRAADKVDVVDTAKRLGVAVPKSVVVRDPGSIPDFDFAFPVVVKPARSRVRTNAGWVSTSVSYAADRAALARDLARRGAHEFPVMLQERIDGPGTGVFACYHHGRAVAFFSHRRLRERPPWGGVAVLSESASLNPIAREYATRLLDDLGWHGVAMVELKQDVRDGIPKLMEINGRFWGSLQLAIDAGVDFPALLLHGVTSGEFAAQPPYPIGVRSRWLWGDVDSLLVTLFGGAGTPGFARRSKLRAIAEFMRFWTPGLRYENPRYQDLRPWLFETSRWFQRGVHDAFSGPRAKKLSS